MKYQNTENDEQGQVDNTDPADEGVATVSICATPALLFLSSKDESRSICDHLLDLLE